MKRFIFLLCSVSLWILRYREISTSVYSCKALFRILGWKKQVLSTLKGKSDGYATVDIHDVESCFICFLWVPVNHPKLILKELFNLQSWIPTSFQHEKNIVPVTSFHFLESWAYCVLLSTSLRTGFYRMKI